MDPLHQRLKELDPDTFHKLCFMLIKERNPGANAHLVEGASGDEGLDIFEGELDGQPTIWQCKSFPNGVGESQKGQIRESLNTALKNFTPKNELDAMHEGLCPICDEPDCPGDCFARFVLDEGIVEPPIQ